MNEDIHPRLRRTVADHVATSMRSLSSVVDIAAPGAGSFFAELTCHVIPGQRNERLLEYVTQLGRNHRRLHESVLELTDRIGRADDRVAEIYDGCAKLALELSPEQVSLFEDGAALAVKSIGKEKIKRIARIVSKGLDDEEVVDRSRVTLWILSQLSDQDVVKLCYFHRNFHHDADWIALHHEIIDPAASKMDQSGALPQWTPEAYDAAAQGDMQLQKLISLGLVEQEVSITTRSDGISPLNDELILKSEPKKSRPKITASGEFVLRQLELVDQ